MQRFAFRKCRLSDCGTHPQLLNVSMPTLTQRQDGQVQVEDQAPLTSSTFHLLSTSSSTTGLSARDLVTTTSTALSTVSSSTTLTQAAYPNANYMNVDLTTAETTSVPDSSLSTLSTSAVQTATASGTGSTAGSVITTLDTSLQPTSQPFPTVIDSSTSLSLVDTATLGSVQPTETTAVQTLSVSSIFVPIATKAPPVQLGNRTDHPVNTSAIRNQAHRYPTNNYYTNFLLDTRDESVFTFPYSVFWSRNRGSLGSWGLAISHTERSQFAFGDPRPGIDAGNSSNFGSPVNIQSIVLSAVEVNVTTIDGAIMSPNITTESLEWGSIQVNLWAPAWKTPTIQFPLVQGASFITGNYSWTTPLIQSGIGFKSIKYDGAVVDNTTFKYTVMLKTNVTWLIYLTPDFNLSPGYPVNEFTLLNSTADEDVQTDIQGHSGYNGLIQVAKLPRGSTDPTYTAPDVQSLYDGAAGAYAANVSINGSVNDRVGTYSFHWDKRGNQNQKLLMFALPHHLSSFDPETEARATDLKLMTPVKGNATAVQGESWTLTETDMPIDMDFAPYSTTKGSIKTLDEDVRSTIFTAGKAELNQTIMAQANVSSFYYDGKALAKFANICYTLHQLVGGNTTWALSGLVELQEAFQYHVDGRQPFPLVYDDVWGGAVSNASYQNPSDPASSGLDFGNSYYNDHHFHYGYFVYAAAVIGYLDPTWIQNTSNVDWVNTLVRDYANSITWDPYYPFSRSFDWYHGHSWAAGLFSSADGKNQESSSEDTMASYAIKMWGQVIGDQPMMARGNLMLAIQRRSLNAYYLYSSDNTILPPNFIGNKCAGILFMNKCDHTTYFGAEPQFIQGIHMIPLMPFSAYIRPASFVQQEWDAYFVDNYTNVRDGWRGILQANSALIDRGYAKKALSFFQGAEGEDSRGSDGKFNVSLLDGGASQTWYLALAGALSM
ncbi:glycoside hydrolase family 81 [Lecanosticta acicola]|uniref:glucan endo-1,3-beta-D-glucosidase n=1 Tax=Lecanosticta acicola TaxID=111012 RepID=A0AAI8YUA5_9PEZI|nr:glycoside hydrolase family 81 [Lecanosticta acicola]